MNYFGMKSGAVGNGEMSRESVDKLPPQGVLPLDDCWAYPPATRRSTPNHARTRGKGREGV